MNKMAVYLNQHINGVAYSAPDVLEQYSTDRSLLHYQPKLVAIPADVTDVRRLVKFSAQLTAKGLELPLSVRGAGFGKNGACLTTNPGNRRTSAFDSRAGRRDAWRVAENARHEWPRITD